MIDLNITGLVEEIQKIQPKTIVMQFPEGIKVYTTEIVQEIEQKTGAKVIALMDPCFGACDLAEDEVKKFNADLLVHLGHSQFISPNQKTIFWPFSYEIEIRPLIKKLNQEMKKHSFKKISLCGTIQYLKYLDEIKKDLEKQKIEVFIAKGNQRISDEGQVLGCNYSSVSKFDKEIDATIYIGDGLFHPVGISFNSRKPVIIINPLNEEVTFLEEQHDKYLRKRFGVISSAMNAKSFGILITTKNGQMQYGLAQVLKKQIEEKGKTAILLGMDLIKPDYVMGIKVDCFVNTACPRIATDDTSNYRVPVLSANELQIVLGNKKLEELKVEEI
ncbi:MAG: diphthamide biosynthesis enzyme Dph2 [archaeon]|nr:diphthamide biosynthesis enzyme Dph2 [archaeon]